MNPATTAYRIIKHLESLPINFKMGRDNRKGRGNSPFRPNSNSDSFSLTVEPDGEHGAYIDHVSNEGGSLYDLADYFNIERPRNGTEQDSKRAYVNLADYAQAHGVTEEVFKAAGWHLTTYDKRPALQFPTKNGPRYRFLDGQKPTFKSPSGYKTCWYGLERAIQIATRTDQPLVICNGEPSTITAQHYNAAAAAMTGSSERPKISAALLAELRQAWPGPIIVALDCDEKGRAAAPAMQAQLSQAGYDARAIDLGLGNAQDLADFCTLHQGDSAQALRQCKDLPETNQQTERKRRRLMSKDYIAKLAELGYKFRLNDTNDRIEINDKPINDIMRHTIRSQMRDAGYRRHLTAIEDAYIATAGANQYHPIKDYLNSLQRKNDLSQIDILARYFADEDGVFSVWLRRWLIGAVAKIYDQAQNKMFVLDGPQGIGKSHFVRWLCPLPDYFVEGPISPDEKDDKIRLMSKWLWEVAELGATTRKADREALKFFLSQQTVTVRQPYHHYDTIKPALCSMVGTINNEAGFLTDPTGSRRFLVCELTKIDWTYSQLIDVDQVWAEAVHLYRQGEKWELTTEEAQRQREINARYQVDSYVMSLFLKYYKLNLDDKNATWISSSDILQELETHGLKGNQKTNAMELAAGLRELGVKRAKKLNRWSYLGIALKTLDDQENEKKALAEQEEAEKK